jgi:beta-ketoacyl synthase-like protein
MSERSYPAHAIAIVGMAARIPGAADLDTFWHNLMDGVDVLQPFGDADLAAARVPAQLAADPLYVPAKLRSSIPSSASFSSVRGRRSSRLAMRATRASARRACTPAAASTRTCSRTCSPTAP